MRKGRRKSSLVTKETIAKGKNDFLTDWGASLSPNRTLNLKKKKPIQNESVSVLLKQGHGTGWGLQKDPFLHHFS